LGKGHVGKPNAGLRQPHDPVGKLVQCLNRKLEFAAIANNVKGCADVLNNLFSLLRRPRLHMEIDKVCGRLPGVLPLTPSSARRKIASI